MTRDCLRPLEGQPVIVSGRLAKVKRTDKEAHYMLAAVRVYAWDGNAPINPTGKPSAAVDHLWCPVPLEHYQPRLPMLKRVMLAGRVGWYARADGTADLGVKVSRTLDLDQAASDYRQNYAKGASASRVADAFDELLREMDLPDALPFSRCMTITEAKRKITRWRDQLRRDAAVESRIRATSIGRGHRPRGARRFTDLLKTK